MTEVIETCPHCGCVNVYPNWDVKTQGYVAECGHCGEAIMLCDACLNADDNKCGKCDWHVGSLTEPLEMCFRGTICHEGGKA